MGRSPIAAIMFFVQGFANRKLDKRPNLNINVKNFVSGVFAGFFYTNMAFVFDLLKVKQQNVRDGKSTYRAQISSIYQKEGISGFTRGY